MHENFKYSLPLSGAVVDSGLYHNIPDTGLALTLCDTACALLTVWKGIHRTSSTKMTLNMDFVTGSRSPTLQTWEEELRSIMSIWFNHGRKDSVKITPICLDLK